MSAKVFLVVSLAALAVAIIAFVVTGIAGLYALDSKRADAIEKKSLITVMVATGIMVLFLLLTFVTAAFGGGV